MVPAAGGYVMVVEEHRHTDWLVTDPDAPPEPAEPAKPRRGTRRAPRRVPKGLLFLVVAAVTSWGVAMNVRVTVGALIITVAVVIVAYLCATRLVSTLRYNRRAATHAAALSARREWDHAHRINSSRVHAYDQDTASLLAGLHQAIINSRTVREEWIGGQWRRTIDATVWRVLVRMRDTKQTRTDLAAAEGLTDGHPDLAAAVEQRAAEVAEVRRDAIGVRDTLTQLAERVAALDVVIGQMERREADRRRAEQLTGKLTGAEPVDQGPDLAAIRAGLVTNDAGNDLRILAAGLDAARNHYATMPAAAETKLDDRVPGVEAPRHTAAEAAYRRSRNTAQPDQ